MISSSQNHNVSTSLHLDDFIAMNPHVKRAGDIFNEIKKQGVTCHITRNNSIISEYTQIKNYLRNRKKSIVADAQFSEIANNDDHFEDSTPVFVDEGIEVFDESLFVAPVENIDEIELMENGEDIPFIVNTALSSPEDYFFTIEDCPLDYITIEGIIYTMGILDDYRLAQPFYSRLFMNLLTCGEGDNTIVVTHMNQLERLAKKMISTVFINSSELVHPKKN